MDSVSMCSTYGRAHSVCTGPVDLIEPNPVDVPVRRNARGNKGGNDGRGYGKSKSVCDESLSADWTVEELSKLIPRLAIE